MVLGDVVVNLKRGSLTSRQAKSAHGLTLHSTDIGPEHRGAWVSFSSAQPGSAAIKFPQKRSLVLAGPGDIVVGRLGRNAVDKVLGIASGEVALSDWLFLVRVPEEHQRPTLARLSSEEGRSWLSKTRYGVASKLLAREDLLKFPLR